MMHVQPLLVDQISELLSQQASEIIPDLLFLLRGWGLGMRLWYWMSNCEHPKYLGFEPVVEINCKLQKMYSVYTGRSRVWMLIAVSCST